MTRNSDFMSEVVSAGGVVWLTKGREIENEIPKIIFEKACVKINRQSAANLDDMFADRLIRADNNDLEIDKIKLANAVVELSTEVPDGVAEEIKKIVEFIGAATLKSV